jgi:hypothetical protein
MKYSDDDYAFQNGMIWYGYVGGVVALKMNVC